ncbi:MAG TPA: hypothetical protein VNQ79_12230 [Blastocatellia bacterium]|nr:hypothetical protein [Blastocatellia bacterium]
MRRFLIITTGLLLLQALAVTALAQPDRLSGRWEGKMQSMRGDVDAVAIFKKEGDTYTGRSTGLRPGTEMLIRDVRIDGDKVTGRSEVETPQATIVINYTFTLDGETMKGQGALDFNGQPVTFELTLKRVSTSTEGPLTTQAPPPSAPGQAARPQRSASEQPQQKQSLDYFIGQWSYKYVGRESALGPAPREGLVTITKNADGKSATLTATGKSDTGAFRESAAITWDEATKTLLFTETTPGGVKLSSKGDWSSPISIRFTIPAVKVKGQTLQLRRTISVVAAHSFTITEELSEDGGPFVRLGNAIYSRIDAK